MIKEIKDLNNKVDEFSEIMKTKLEKHRHKPGWKPDSSNPSELLVLLGMLKDEVNELEEAIRLGDRDEIKLESADVANYAMIIADSAADLYSKLEIRVPKSGWFSGLAGNEESFGYFAPIIYVQGCNINCPGCHNPDLQDGMQGMSISIRDIISRIRGQGVDYEAVVIQGGEPLEQRFIYDLIEAISSMELKVILYTGFSEYDIQGVDILKAGAYGSDQHVFSSIPIKCRPGHFLYHDDEEEEKDGSTL